MTQAMDSRMDSRKKTSDLGHPSGDDEAIKGGKVKRSSHEDEMEGADLGGSDEIE
jgi:hypothetical protein